MSGGVTEMEVQLDRPRHSERQIVPSAMTLSADVYWIPVAHDLPARNFSASKVSQCAATNRCRYTVASEAV